MSSALDMSLDDIIKNSKKSAAPRGGGAIRGGGAVRGGGSFRGGGARGSGFGGSGPARRIPNWSLNRPAPYAIGGKAPDSAWQHDLFSEQLGGFGAPAAAARSAAGIETGTKLYISNLDYGVSNEDIKELFSEVGDLKRFSIHYDRSGRSKGTAEVVFSRRSDALAAVKRYNNVQLDGKLMKIEVVGTNISPPAVVPPFTNGGFGNPNGFPRSVPAIPGPARGGFIGVPRGGGRIRGRGGRGRGRGRGESVSAADLDADLDKYHHESMQIS